MHSSALVYLTLLVSHLCPRIMYVGRWAFFLTMSMTRLVIPRSAPNLLLHFACVEPFGYFYGHLACLHVSTHAARQGRRQDGPVGRILWVQKLCFSLRSKLYLSSHSKLYFSQTSKLYFTCLIHINLPSFKAAIYLAVMPVVYGASMPRPILCVSQLPWAAPA